MNIFLDDVLFTISHFFVFSVLATLTLVLGIPCFILLYFCFLRKKLSSIPSTRSLPHDIKGATYCTFYFEASDGVHIAVDVWLPDQSSHVSNTDDYVVGAKAADDGEQIRSASATLGYSTLYDDEERDAGKSVGRKKSNTGTTSRKPTPTMVCAARYWRR
jgi:hypothetical protein